MELKAVGFSQSWVWLFEQTFTFLIVLACMSRAITVSAKQQLYHLQSAVVTSRHVTLSVDKSRQRGTLLASHHGETDKLLPVPIFSFRHCSHHVQSESGLAETTVVTEYYAFKGRQYEEEEWCIWYGSQRLD